jgi:methyl-accepting chemotaxis protein
MKSKIVKNTIARFKPKRGSRTEKSDKTLTKQKSIKTDFLRLVSVLLTIVIAVLSALSIYFIDQSTTESLEKSMRETSDLVAEQISLRISGFDTTADAVGDYYVQAVGRINIIDYLSNISKKFGYEQIDIVNTTSSKSVLTEKDYTSDSTISEFAGNTAVLSEPIADGETVSFKYIYPYQQYIIVVFVPYSFFEDIIKSVRVGATGSTYILDKSGTKVVHSDKTLVIEHQNNLEEVKKNPQIYKEVASLERKMIQGKSGFGFYTWNGDKKIGSYAPIEGTDGWSVNVSAQESEFMSKLKISLLCMIGFGFLILGFAITVTWKVTGNMVKPIRNMLESVEKIYKGDLSVELHMIRKDEVGIMAEKINGMVATYRTLIRDISRVLESLADQDLTVSVHADYPGEFETVKNSLLIIIKGLNETISQFSASSLQVRAGASQVSAGAQALAQGALEQADSIEELSNNIEQVSAQITCTAQDAEQSNIKMSLVSKELEECNKKMKEMVFAMAEMNNTSGEIGAIIKTIEDIAFQTNILALNAAIEAARAGENGKGFAVVANEVRNLAGKSAKAAQNTAALIQHSIDAVQKGSSAVDKTASSLGEAGRSADEVSGLVRRISVSAQEQAESVSQINAGIEQVFSVVQATSATSEESAASSEELLAQADELQARVSHFNRKDNNENKVFI